MSSRVIPFFAGVLVLLSLFQLQPMQAGRPPQPQRGPLAFGTTACAAKPDVVQQMFVPLAHLRYFDGAEILLNNNGVDPLVVRPMWFVRGSEPVKGRPVTMPPLTMEVKQIGALLPDGVPASRIDGLLLEYDGKMMELGGQVVLRHASTQAADTLDVHFSMGMDFHSSRREATWTSTPGESAILVLANTAGEPTKVTIASSSESRTVVMDPYQAELVRLEVPVPGKGDTGKQAMWAVIDSTGVPADLRVTGFVSPAAGAPRLIRFYDPSAVKQPHLYATRMRVTNARGDLALKNTSAVPITARAAFLDGESGQPLYELPPVTLGPNAARTIDLGSAMAALAGSTRSEAVSVRVDNTGPIGALIGSLYVHDTKNGTPFDVPLRDSGAARSSTGSYPWRIDGDYETRASITNAGTVTAQFVARIAYDGDGELVFGPRELAPGASATFDLRALRDQGTKDSKLRVLPPGAERGRFIWTILTSGQSARLVGRAEVTSTKLGVSSSYSCGQCCPDSWLFSTISPYEQSMSIGTSAAYTIVGYWENCYHQQWSMNISPYGWNVNSPSVASLASQYPGGRATGQGDGTTDFAGWWGVERWEPYIEDCVVDSWSWEQPGRAQVCPVTPVAAYNPDPYPLDTGNLTQGTQNALSCLQNALQVAGGSLTVTSAYRPQSYQDHLREVWDKWQAIRNRNDQACAQTKQQVQTEWDRHQLAFQPAAVSNHTGGTAFDANWTGSVNIDQLANGCSLSRSVPGDNVHFVYTGS